MKSENTKPPTNNADYDDIQPEYNLEGVKGERGKYYRRLLAIGYKPVILQPEVAAAFPDSESVNEALRQVIALGELTKRKKPKAGAKSKRASSAPTVRVVKV